MNRLYLIWSYEHNAWWNPKEMGYTTYRDLAGRYGYEQALSIVRSANIMGTINEVMIPDDEITKVPIVQ